MQRIRHQLVGGATTFSTFTGSTCLELKLNKSSLRRSIEHHIDFGIRPKSIPHNHSTTPSLTPSHFLNVHNIGIPVIYPTHMTSTGLGIRQLSPSELANIFGLNSALHSFVTLDTFPFPPVTILEFLLHPILQPSSKSSRPTMLKIPTAIIPKFNLIHNVGLLPISWSEVNYKVDKAAKNDDVEPVFRHWDDRILLLLPNAAPLLSPLRRWLYGVVTRRLFLELKKYLCTTYGSDWTRFFKTAKS